MQKVMQKICSVCAQQKDSSNFLKGKRTCRTCYNEKYNQIYKQKRANEKKQKEMELKKTVVEEYEALLEENTKLKKKLEDMEKIITGNELERIIDENKKLKTICDVIRKATEQLPDEKNIVD